MVKYSHPHISVIVTTYNREELICETIDSILNQTFNNFELIIVDDGSTDGTEKIISNYKDERIKYIKIDNWGRPAGPRNIGIKEAKGKFIAFCDDDDYWMPNKLMVQLQSFDDNLIGVGTNAFIIGGKNRLKHQNMESDILLGMNNILILKSNVFSSLMIKNKPIYFDESKEMSFAEDFEYNLKLVLSSGQKIKLLEKPLVYYRRHPENNVTNLNHAVNALNVAEKYKGDISPEQLASLYHNIYSCLSGIAFIDAPKKCRLYYLKSLKYNRYYLKGFLIYCFSFFPISIRQLIMN